MSPKGQEKAPNKVAGNGQRDGKGRFVSGHKSNGGGRPAVAREFRARLQQFMTEEGLNLLLTDARRPGRLGFQARELVMAYAYGRPPQKMEMSGADGAALRVEFVEIIRAAADA